MKELTKKVIILNNFSSPYISEAIILLKDYNPKLEGKVIEDAERIVAGYIDSMQKNGQPRRTARKKGRWLKIAISLALTAAFCAGLKYLFN